MDIKITWLDGKVYSFSEPVAPLPPPLEPPVEPPTPPPTGLTKPTSLENMKDNGNGEYVSTSQWNSNSMCNGALHFDLASLTWGRTIEATYEVSATGLNEMSNMKYPMRLCKKGSVIYPNIYIGKPQGVPPVTSTGAWNFFLAGEFPGAVTMKYLNPALPTGTYRSEKLVIKMPSGSNKSDGTILFVQGGKTVLNYSSLRVDGTATGVPTEFTLQFDHPNTSFSGQLKYRNVTVKVI